MEWLEPWTAASQLPENIRAGVERQLKTEVPPGHVLYNVPIRLLARE